jgi:hypothetical protein
MYLTRQVNSYFAILIITIAGALAAVTIINVGTTTNLPATLSGSEANYAELEKSILNN